MIKVCAWCQKELPRDRADGVRDGKVTHGICDVCAENLASPNRAGVLEFLESLSEPVFLAGSDSRTVPGNSQARRLAGGDPAETGKDLVGDIFDCANSSLPGGCGRTECCRACTIRAAVSETIEKGRSVIRRRTYLDVRTANGVRRKHFHVSTLRAGDAVLLKIEEAE